MFVGTWVGSEIESRVISRAGMLTSLYVDSLVSPHAQSLAGGGELAGPVRATFGKLLPLLAGIIAEGQKSGDIRPGDPVLLALSTVAQPVYLNLARPVISKVAGIDPRDERVIEHAVAMVRSALRP